jgi:vesicle-fusing ATPase
MQYGGPERNYEAVDMGPCILMEMILLPKGLESETPLGTNVVGLPVSPDTYLVRASPKHATEPQRSLSHPNSAANVRDWDKTFSITVGGLEPQIEQIIRRVLDGRVLRPVSGREAFENDTDESDTIDRIRRDEMQGLMDLGLQPVRGLLLYGPPGCGKTALAREISNILDAVPPKIVSAPELLDRWVGGSEKLIRELFIDAENELRACGGDATKSALHVIVIDEIDAVFRKRSASEGSAEVTRASAVNQILSKLDGVQALNNVLVIGMTNRKELLDPALLRPGRLEVHIEIPLPDQNGRREILKLQFDALRRSGRLSQPLCRAIDGATNDRISIRGWPRRLLRRLPMKMFSAPPASEILDLSAPRWTGGWSGADIAGLVRSSGSLALTRTRNQGGTIPDDLLITLEDVRMALKELKS